jgi:cysteine desulfurase
MNQTIYLDYAASTPIDKRVSAAMVRCLNSEYSANPSASHRLGKIVSDLIERNRYYVSKLINADSSEIIWTSGATESNNLAIIGTVLANKHLGNHIITSMTEHDSVLQVCKYLESLGFSVTYLNPLQDGSIDLSELNNNITNKTILVSIMLVNNETGVVQDIQKISNIVKSKDIFLHVDATQAVGKIPIDVNRLAVDLMSFSAHKMYGPKGIGALYIREQSQITINPIFYGGLQERNLRPGTLVTHQIVGFGEACKIAINEVERDFEHAKKIRSHFFQSMQGYIRANFSFAQTLPYIFNVHFIKMNDVIKKQLDVSDTLMLSSKSSCSNHKENNYSHVLQAIGICENTMKNSYRISVGRHTTEEEIFAATSILKKMHREQCHVLASV